MIKCRNTKFDQKNWGKRLSPEQALFRRKLTYLGTWKKLTYLGNSKITDLFFLQQKKTKKTKKKP